tara:strand:+ start:328 stop:435 length:108 start_codon:yes stop_codon:yes gene_type:complete
MENSVEILNEFGENENFLTLSSFFGTIQNKGYVVE